MSGHSKWSNIKHHKALTDVVKAKNFTKASRGITVAVRESGGVSDPTTNFRLRLAIEKAKEVNMPKDNIERAIAKGKGESGEQFESLVYEAYGPAGSAFIIEAATENKQRTVSAIKNVLDHHGGTLATPGSVAYQFNRQGLILMNRPVSLPDDEVYLLAADFGATDVRFYDNEIEILCDPSQLESVSEKLVASGLDKQTKELVYTSTMPIQSSASEVSSIDNLEGLLLDLDDVQKVSSNVEL